MTATNPDAERLCDRRVRWQILRRDQTFITEVRQEAHLREYLGWH